MSEIFLNESKLVITNYGYSFIAKVVYLPSFLALTNVVRVSDLIYGSLLDWVQSAEGAGDIKLKTRHWPNLRIPVGKVQFVIDTIEEWAEPLGIPFSEEKHDEN